jgi:hypothetical protein
MISPKIKSKSKGKTQKAKPKIEPQLVSAFLLLPFAF